MKHSYQSRQGCLVCTICGAAKHKAKYKGFKYWFAGVGYKQEKECKRGRP